MKNLLMIISVYLLITPLYTKSQPVTFEKKYDFGFAEGAGDIVQTSDGGYLLVGGQSVTINHVNLLTMKTDAQGDLQWHKITGSGGEWSQHRIVQINDSVYYTAGHSNVYTGNPAARDFLLVKMNGNGDTIWTRTYGGSQNEICNDFKATSDGGLILAGYTASFGNNVPAYFVKTDLNGDTLWTKYWSSPFGGANASSIIETYDGGYASTGGTMDQNNQVATFILKLNASGSVEWYKLFNSTDIVGKAAYGYDIIQLPDSGFILLGIGSRYEVLDSLYYWNNYIIRTNSSGDSIASELFHYPKGDYISQGQLINSNEFIFTGGIVDLSNLPGGNASLKKLDIGLNLLWKREYGGSGTDEGYNLIITTDGGFAVVGSTNSNCSACVYFIKTDSLGCVVPGCHLVGVEDSIIEDGLFTIFPNPATNYFIIRINEKISGNFKINMYDMTGRQISLPVDEKIPVGNYLIYVPVEFLSTGMYYITITDKELRKVYSNKIIIH